MAGIFLKLFNMSITACWIVLAVIVFRLLFRKAPKWINCILWGVVGLRLILPFSFKSILSLIPSTKTIAPNPESFGRPFVVNTGIGVINSEINEYLGSHYYEGLSRPANNFVNTLDIASKIWLIGMACLLVYGIVSYIRLAKKVRPSLNREDNVYYCDNIDSPFILGLIKPKIYLPSHISDEQAAYVIAHEKAHLKRKDHWWKPLGFVLFTVYWFNPVMWLAYILLCRDIEQACDEKVVKDMGIDYKKGYSHALVACSVKRFSIAACPLAFGEVAVKDRIKSVLNYKKPAFWIIIVALLVCVGVAVCFLTDPKDKDGPDMPNIAEGVGVSSITGGTDCDWVKFDFISGMIDGNESYIEARWVNNSSDILCFGRPFTLYKDGEVIERTKAGAVVSSTKAESIIEYITEPFVRAMALLMVDPGERYTERYDLSSFSLTEGEYRIEKLFYLDGDRETVYTAYINFTVEANGALNRWRTALCYEPDGPSYYNPVLSFQLEKFPTFYVLDGEGYIEVNNINGTSTTLHNLGQLEKIDVAESGFTDKIEDMFDEKGIEEELKNNNLNAYRVRANNTGMTLYYYLFEQKSGECYMAMASNSVLYCVFKMKPYAIYTQVEGDMGDILESSGPAGIEQLRERYPEVFKLSTDRGLQVWVSSFAEGNYRFSVTDGENRTKNIIELTTLPSFSAEEMKAILSTYNLPSSDIAVIPYQNMYSSYLWFDKESDVEMLRQMLGLE